MKILYQVVNSVIIVPIDHDLHDISSTILQVSNQPFNYLVLLVLRIKLLFQKMQRKLLPNIRVMPLLNYQILPLLLVEQNLLYEIRLLLLELARRDEEGERLINKSKCQVEDLHEVAAHDLVFLWLL